MTPTTEVTRHGERAPDYRPRWRPNLIVTHGDQARALVARLLDKFGKAFPERLQQGILAADQTEDGAVERLIEQVRSKEFVHSLKSHGWMIRDESLGDLFVLHVYDLPEGIETSRPKLPDVTKTLEGCASFGTTIHLVELVLAFASNVRTLQPAYAELARRCNDGRRRFLLARHDARGQTMSAENVLEAGSRLLALLLLGEAIDSTGTSDLHFPKELLRQRQAGDVTGLSLVGMRRVIFPSPVELSMSVGRTVFADFVQRDREAQNEGSAFTERLRQIISRFDTMIDAVRRQGPTNRDDATLQAEAAANQLRDALSDLLATPLSELTAETRIPIKRLRTEATHALAHVRRRAAAFPATVVLPEPQPPEPTGLIALLKRLLSLSKPPDPPDPVDEAGPAIRSVLERLSNDLSLGLERLRIDDTDEPETGHYAVETGVLDALVTVSRLPRRLARTTLSDAASAGLKRLGVLAANNIVRGSDPFDGVTGILAEIARGHSSALTPEFILESFDTLITDIDDFVCAVDLLAPARPSGPNRQLIWAGPKPLLGRTAGAFDEIREKLQVPAPGEQWVRMPGEAPTLDALLLIPDVPPSTLAPLALEN